jgi:hypothetical protein
MWGKSSLTHWPDSPYCLKSQNGLRSLRSLFFSEGGFTDADKVEALAVTFDEIRFVVEAVDMAGTAGHEQEDDALGAGGEKRGLRSEGVGVALRSAGEHGIESQRTETTSGGFEKLPSIRAHHELEGSLI